MQVRFVEKNGTVIVQGRVNGYKWNKNKKPLRTIKANPGWYQRLLVWARKQGHMVIEQQ